MIQNYLNDPLLQNYMAPSYPIFIQIKYLLSAATGKKPSKTTKSDILQLVNKVGSEGERFILTSLMEMIEAKEYKEKSQSSAKIAFLTQLLKEYSYNESFLSYFPQVILNLNLDESKFSDLVSNLLMSVKLPIQNQIIMVLALYLSDLRELSKVGEIELERKLKQLRAIGKGTIDIPEKILEELLFQISQNPSLQERLQPEFQFLIEACDNYEKLPCAKMFNYLSNDWQYFAAQQILIEKPPPITIKKVDFLRDIGPTATNNLETLKILMNQFGTTTEEDVFQCLLMMSQEKFRVDTGVEKFISDLLVANKKNLKSQDLKKIYSIDIGNKKTQSSWNIENFITFCSQNIQNLKWQNVYNHLDRSKLEIKNEESFLSLMKSFEKVRKQGPKFKIPENIFFKKWINPQSQSNFLINIFKCKEIESIGLVEIPNKRIQKSVKDCNQLPKQIWGYLDLVQLLIEISDHNYLEIRELFEIPLSKYPELLIQTLSQIRPIKGQAMLDQIFSQIFPVYLQNHSNYIRLLENLWEANQDLVISSICELYKSQSKKENSLNLSRVLDIAQVIKESLIPLTNWNDYDFAVPLAILAGKRQFLHFEPWITDRIKNAGNPFLKSTLGYIEDHLLVPIRKCIETNQHFNYQVILEKAQLSKELLAFIFQSIFLTTSSNKMTKRNLESLKRIYKEVCQYFPEMSQSQMPDQIQQLAQRQFIKIYKKEITIDEAIEHMRKLKNSTKAQEKELFASMITFMYSELRFHVSYPENELLITAELFAGIINQNLIDKKLVQVLLQVLEDDLKEDNKKYLFAKIVIDKIRSKLVNEAEFCQKLLDNYQVLHKDPQLVETLIKAIEPPLHLSIEKQKKLKEAIKIKNSPPEPVVVVQPSEEEVHSEEKKNQKNDFDILITLDRTKQIVAGDKESKLSKINTICNTLALNNIDEKAKDLQKIIDSKNALLLLAYNIVFKRVPLSAQNNAGIEIFYRLVQKIPKLQKPVKLITYKILEAWFSIVDKSVNDKKISNFKSLGFWLGKLTLAKGVPILISKINIKQILINSYTQYSSRLPLNVSVIVKMLEHITVHRDIFRVSNPWLGRILGTLNEIEQKLKEDNINTKSQIKGFFLNTDIKKNSSIPSTSYLDKNEFPLISRLPEYIKISQELHQYYIKLGVDLKMIITKAVDDSIQEIVEPVIDRAVKIAIVTAKQLILKDFALETDPDKFKTSFNNVVKKLAGPLAQVTCRQPLKASMNRTLKNYLTQSIQDSNEIETIIAKAIPDNLDLGCALIKKAVIESAEEAIRKDELINDSIDHRTQAFSQGKQFRDQNYLREIPAIVPQELRPKIGGLSLEEFLVYDEFRKEKKISTTENVEISNSQKLAELFAEKGQAKALRQLIFIDSTIKDELVEKVHTAIVKENKEQQELENYLEICDMLKQFIEPLEAWNNFKEKADFTKKQICNLIRKLVREKYFPDSCLAELDEGNEEEQKAINMFEKWLDTAHEQIEPFLQSLQQIFNKSQNQIRLFFEYSLNYALQKVQNSISEYHQTMDTTYIEDYSKLIIISYKLIASNNSSLFIQHTLQAILQVFNKLMGKETKISYQRAFFKLFLNLICDATRKQYDFHKDKVTAFYYILARQFHKINPLLYSNFAFAWVELISNKYFMPTLLEKYEYWDLYYELICDLFRFAKEHLTEENLNQHVPYQTFYKGIMRIIIILIHDFPDFLSVFSLQLCLQIPDKFIQIRNIVISSYPKELKFKSPKAIANRQQLDKEYTITSLPKYYKLKFDKVKYNQFISLFQSNDKTLKQKLEGESDENLQIFVLYFAWLEQCQLNLNNSRKLFIDIVVSLEGDLKDKFIKFALNLIRYPNSITLFFIDFVTNLIFKGTHEKTRNLLLIKLFQRMNVESAHPWGLLFLVNQFQAQKGELAKLQISKDILNRL